MRAMLLLGLLPLLHASDEACTACCRAGGLAGCQSSLQLYGEGSRTSREGASYRVTGLWDVSCAGAGEFDYGATALLDHEPQYGELVMPMASPLQVHCFRQGCDLPADTCLSAADGNGRFYLQGCDDGLPADAQALRRAPSAPKYASGSTVVVVEGKPLVVQAPVATSASSVATSAAPVATSAAPVATGPWSVTTSTTSYATNTAPVTTSSTTYAPSPYATSTAPVATAPPPVATAPPPVATPTGDPLAQLAASLPNDPPATCRPPPDAVRAEARKQVDTGDDKRVRHDSAGAIQAYRAALTMDVCNAYGWLGIGQVATEMGRPDLAIRALRNATRLLPNHYGAWTLLGKNYESIRQAPLASGAYEKALALKPDLPEALDGWRRTAAP
jgi:hypothetical protein